MKEFILITGERGSGKSTRASDIIGANDSVLIDANNLDDPFVFMHVKTNVKYIHVTEADSEAFDKMLYIFKSGFIIIDIPGMYQLKVNCPNVIVEMKSS